MILNHAALRFRWQERNHWRKSLSFGSKRWLAAETNLSLEGFSSSRPRSWSHSLWFTSGSAFRILNIIIAAVQRNSDLKQSICWLLCLYSIMCIEEHYVYPKTAIIMTICLCNIIIIMIVLISLGKSLLLISHHHELLL